MCVKADHSYMSITQVWGGGDRQIPGVHWPARLTESLGSWFRERPCLKNNVNKQLKTLLLVSRHTHTQHGERKREREHIVLSTVRGEDQHEVWLLKRAGLGVQSLFILPHVWAFPEGN